MELSLKQKKTNQKIYLTKRNLLKSIIPKGCYWRLHAESFSIKILESTNKYKQLLETSDIKYKDNNTICLYKNRLVIWSNTDFWGENPKESLYESQKYWNKFLKEIQLEYGVLLIKEQNTRIHKFRQHIAHIDDPIAKANKRNGEFKVLDDNGELIFIADNSFGLIEGEWVHPRKALTNANTHQRFIKDLERNKDAMMLGELTYGFKGLIEQSSRMNSQIEKSLEIGQLNQQHIQILIKMNQNLIQMLTPKEKMEENKINPVMDWGY